MSQIIFSTIDDNDSGDQLATILDDFKNAVVSGFSGTSRPANLNIGGYWIDTTSDPTSWAFKIWTGTTDVSIFTINLSTGVAAVALAVDSFIVKKISADTAGALMELVKRRIATNGQVLDGDTVGEIQLIGRTDSSGNPIVAKIVFVSSDNETTSSYGGELAFYSTPDATATLTKHMRFINGVVETIVPHKLNSLVLVGQNVATTATIAQLSASQILVEMTGSTGTDIQGINSGGSTKEITIHNRSTAYVNLKHQNASASAADRLSLPSSADYEIAPDASATLYYCTAQSFWKLKSTTDKTTTTTVDTLYGTTNTWTAPVIVSAVRVRAYRRAVGISTEYGGLLDIYGNAYAWGINTNGNLGTGTVTPASSPIAVLGGLTFVRLFGNNGVNVSNYGIDRTGAAYAWGGNSSSQLGVAADVLARSSPVAVLGGLKYNMLYPRDASAWGISTGNSAYAWGVNTNGQLGIGSVTLTSSPVAVLGGLKLAKLLPISGASNSASVCGLTTAGVAYAWGINTNGNLGTGTVTAVSSPVAVLGSLTLAEIGGGAVSSRYFYVGLTTAGAAYAWGSNTNSQLGVGDQTPRSSPVAVLGGLTFARIFTHPKSETVMALTAAGALYAWGDNTSGVVGDGTIINKSSPVAVLGGLTFSKVRLYKSMAIGITSDGTAYAWGHNANGQLGVGDVTMRSSPVAVLGGLKFSDIHFADGATDGYTVYGVQADGTLYAWGANTNGTIGDGTVLAKSSPVAVLGAFSPDPRETVTSLDLTVTPSTSYTVSLSTGTSSFGATPLGRDIYKVEVEYLQ